MDVCQVEARVGVSPCHGKKHIHFL
jgi:hypothetical protein